MATTIDNNTSYLIVNDNGKTVVIHKPFTCQIDTFDTIYLRDSFKNEKIIFLSELIGWTYSTIEDLQTQLLVLNANADYVSTVNTYSELPDPTTLPNRFFFVKISTGTKWLPASYGGTYYPNGTYYSDGIEWITGASIYQSVQRVTGTIVVSNPTSNPETGLAKEATLLTRLSKTDFDNKIGSLTEISPASDTASSGLNGRLQRIAQRLATLISTPITLPTGSTDIYYNEVLSVGSSTLTNIITHVSIISESLSCIFISGTNIAEYKVLLNANIIIKIRTGYTALNETIIFPTLGLNLVAGDVITVNVIHIRPSIGDFNATLKINS